MGTLEGIVEILRALKPLLWALAILWVGKTAVEVYDERFNPNPVPRMKVLPKGYVEISPSFNRLLPGESTEALALIRARARSAGR